MQLLIVQTSFRKDSLKSNTVRKCFQPNTRVWGTTHAWNIFSDIWGLVSICEDCCQRCSCHSPNMDEFNILVKNTEQYFAIFWTNKDTFFIILPINQYDYAPTFNPYFLLVIIASFTKSKLPFLWDFSFPPSSLVIMKEKFPSRGLSPSFSGTALDPLRVTPASWG